VDVFHIYTNEKEPLRKSAIQATFRFKLLTGIATRSMLGSVTDRIILTVKNDSVIGDNMGFPDDGLTSHSGFREQDARS